MSNLETDTNVVNASFLDLFKSALKDIPGYQGVFNHVNDITQEGASFEEIEKNLDELFRISLKAHPAFTIFTGKNVLTPFKKLGVKALNLCTYDEEEVDFV